MVPGLMQDASNWNKLYVFGVVYGCKEQHGGFVDRTVQGAWNPDFPPFSNHQLMIPNIQQNHLLIVADSSKSPAGEPKEHFIEAHLELGARFALCL